MEFAPSSLRSLSTKLPGRTILPQTGSTPRQESDPGTLPSSIWDSAWVECMSLRLLSASAFGDTPEYADPTIVSPSLGAWQAVLALHLSHLFFPRIRKPPHLLSQHTLRFAWLYACAIEESMRFPACLTLECRTNPVLAANVLSKHHGQQKLPLTLN